jgi:DNA-binding transcriptional LysR family regulator
MPRDAPVTSAVSGVVPTASGRAFLDHARLALAQVDAAKEAARRAAQTTKQSFAVGFLTGIDIDWLPAITKVMREALRTMQMTVSSDYSPDLADGLQRGRLDVAHLGAVMAPEWYGYLTPTSFSIPRTALVTPASTAMAAPSSRARARMLSRCANSIMLARDLASILLARM